MADTISSLGSRPDAWCVSRKALFLLDYSFDAAAAAQLQFPRRADLSSQLAGA
jgi:hypothetical protein